MSISSSDNFSSGISLVSIFKLCSSQSASSRIICREKLIGLAVAAEQCERFDEMAVCMSKAVQIDPKLTSSERSLFESAFRHIISPRRLCLNSIIDLERCDHVRLVGTAPLPPQSTWATLSAVLPISQCAEHPQGSSAELSDSMQMQTVQQVYHIAAYKQLIKAEIDLICENAIDLVEQYLLPAVTDVEEKVFYLKMKGDYHQYAAEWTSEAIAINVISSASDGAVERSTHREKALASYIEAAELADQLPPTSLVVLSLFLSYSVFTYEILKEHGKALQIAVSAFERAMPSRGVSAGSVESATVGRVEAQVANGYVGDSYISNEALFIIQQLKENLRVWTLSDSGIAVAIGAASGMDLAAGGLMQTAGTRETGLEKN